jgi:FSR family fosmidomycin resistance protein-like MFS transporter
MKTKTLEKGGFILSYSLVVMALSHTLTHVLSRIHNAIFPILRDEFSLSLTQLGIIAAIPPLCQVLLSLPMGLLSDRIGSKKMVLASQAIAAIGSILASLTMNPFMIIIAVSLIFINTTIYHPAAYSFTTKLFRPRDRPKALGIHGAGGTLGYAIGPISVSILMGLLAFKWRQVYLFWLFPIILGIASILLLKSSEETSEEVSEKVFLKEETGESDERGGFLSPSLIMFLIYRGLRSMGRDMIASFLVIFLVDVKGLTGSISSFIFGSNNLMGFIAAPLGGLIASRMGEKRWLLSVLLISYLSLTASVLTPNIALFVTFYMAHGFFSFLGMAANSAIVARLTPRRQRGLGYALFFLPPSIMGALSPMIAAYIGEAFGLEKIFFASIAVYFIGLLVIKFGVKVDSSEAEIHARATA